MMKFLLPTVAEVSDDELRSAVAGQIQAVATEWRTGHDAVAPLVDRVHHPLHRALANRPRLFLCGVGLHAEDRVPEGAVRRNVIAGEVNSKADAVGLVNEPEHVRRAAARKTVATLN